MLISNPKTIRIKLAFFPTCHVKYLHITSWQRIISTNKSNFLERILTTPPLNGLILPGVTRQSILQLAHEWGEFEIQQRTITMGEVINLQEENRVSAKAVDLVSIVNKNVSFSAFGIVRVRNGLYSESYIFGGIFREGFTNSYD